MQDQRAWPFFISSSDRAMPAKKQHDEMQNNFESAEKILTISALLRYVARSLMIPSPNTMQSYDFTRAGENLHASPHSLDSPRAMFTCSLVDRRVQGCIETLIAAHISNFTDVLKLKVSDLWVGCSTSVRMLVVDTTYQKVVSLSVNEKSNPNLNLAPIKPTSLITSHISGS